MDRLLTTLEQWRCAVAVRQEGGFAAAAQALHKSQSSVSHAVGELSARLGLPLFEIQGRRAVLTEAGAILLDQGARLLRDAAALEAAAKTLTQGFDVRLQIAVDAIVPNALVIDALNRFSAAAPVTRVDVHETVLSGTLEALEEGRADLALSAFVPVGFVGTPLIEVDFIAVAAADHPLHSAATPLTFDDLRDHRQLVVRDSGRRDYDAGWLGSERRWTFSSHASALDALIAGSGFAWMPRHRLTDVLAAGRVQPLALAHGGRRTAMIQVVERPARRQAPSCRALADAFIDAARDVPTHD